MKTVQYSTSFGTWLEKKRGASTLRDFASLTGVDIGTISRTERGDTEIQLESAIRICRGLGLSLSSLFQDWLGRTLPVSCQHQPESMGAAGVLTFQEIERWLQYLLQGHRRSREILIAVLNLIVLRSGLASAPLPQLANLFELHDVDKMLWDLPFFRFEVVPPIHDDQLIEGLDMRVYQPGGLLLPLEIGAFVHRLRERLELSPKKLCDQCHVPLHVLSGIESGTRQRLLLGSLLQLDEAIDMQGLLVALFWWEAEARFDLEAAWQKWPEATVYTPASLRKTASLLISVGRWLQYIYRDDTTWLCMLRSELGLASPCRSVIGGESC